MLLVCLQMWLILHWMEVIVPFLAFYTIDFLPTFNKLSSTVLVIMLRYKTLCQYWYWYWYWPFGKTSIGIGIGYWPQALWSIGIGIGYWPWPSGGIGIGIDLLQTGIADLWCVYIYVCVLCATNNCWAHRDHTWLPWLLCQHTITKVKGQKQMKVGKM